MHQRFIIHRPNNRSSVEYVLTSVDNRYRMHIVESGGTYTLYLVRGSVGESYQTDINLLGDALCAAMDYMENPA